jgi:hypothetical protein
MLRGSQQVFIGHHADDLRILPSDVHVFIAIRLRALDPGYDEVFNGFHEQTLSSDKIPFRAPGPNGDIGTM